MSALPRSSLGRMDSWSSSDANRTEKTDSMLISNEATGAGTCRCPSIWNV